MLISNGKTTRNIAEKQLPEYEAKGYKALTVEKPIEKTEKPKLKKGKE